MRNRYPGVCYHCGSAVAVGDGHFERQKGRWLTIHAECVFAQRRQKVHQRLLQDDQRLLKELLS